MLRRAVLFLLLMMSSHVYADVPIIDQSEDANSESSIENGRASRPVSIDQRVAHIEQQQLATQNLNLLNKINNLQEQLQQQQGQIEVLQHDLQQANEMLRKQYIDLDARLSDAKSKYKISVDAAEKPDDTKTSATNKTSINSLDNKKTMQLDPATPANFTGKRSDDADYAAAYECVKLKKYDEGSAALQTYLSQYPQGKHILDAKFYLANAYLKQNKFSDAADQLKQIIEKNPQYEKIMEAHFKLAQAYYGDENWMQAREMYTKVTELYPRTKTAKLALNKLQEMNRKKLFDNESGSDDNNDT